MTFPLLAGPASYPVQSPDGRLPGYAGSRDEPRALLARGIPSEDELVALCTSSDTQLQVGPGGIHDLSRIFHHRSFNDYTFAEPSLFLTTEPLHRLSTPAWLPLLNMPLPWT